MSVPTAIPMPIRLQRRWVVAVALALVGAITATVLALTLSGGGGTYSIDSKQEQQALLQEAMLEGFPGLATGLPVDQR
jgi:hypothetical protein